MINAPAHTASGPFNDLYIGLRKKEGRIYSDEELANLPEISKGHPLAGEWNLRARSCRRLLQFLSMQQRSLNILEVGCGNGWLSHRLAGIKDSRITGTDINGTEIDDAKRVFAGIPNLRFIQGDIRDGIQDEKFDVIIFASSIQYFHPIADILDISLNMLATGGTIHILDSRFYPPAEAKDAMQRSQQYFDSMGFPGMATHYYHHTLESISQYNYKIHQYPGQFIDKVFGNHHPFHWISISGKNKTR
jgi:SAM-dependent methyltransferase